MESYIKNWGGQDIVQVEISAIETSPPSEFDALIRNSRAYDGVYVVPYILDSMDGGDFIHVYEDNAGNFIMESDLPFEFATVHTNISSVIGSIDIIIDQMEWNNPLGLSYA